MLAKFSDVKTDKAVLTWDSDEDLREGMDVYVADEMANMHLLLMVSMLPKMANDCC